jgi:hypothetical protein
MLFGKRISRQKLFRCKPTPLSRSCNLLPFPTHRTARKFCAMPAWRGDYRLYWALHMSLFKLAHQSADRLRVYSRNAASHYDLAAKQVQRRETVRVGRDCAFRVLDSPITADLPYRLGPLFNVFIAAFLALFLAPLVLGADGSLAA